MAKNINTPDYWDWRFASGDWEAKKGRSQTEGFASAQIRWVDLASDFAGTLLDFGCGMGDAMEVYRRAFPRASLMGIDISPAAIQRCRENYGSIASFSVGDFKSVPAVDAIIASNVLEHLDNDKEVAKWLLSQCQDLFIVVPYREHPRIPEHVNAYDETSFTTLSPGRYSYHVFSCPGWTPSGFRDLWWNIYCKNPVRAIVGRPTIRKNLQIIYHLKRH